MDLPLGTKIEARHVAQMEALVGKEPAGSFHELSQVTGKVTKTAIMSGQILMAPEFVEAGQGSSLAAVVAANKRAVTVRVDDVVGVAGFLLPGNRVDVIATRKLDRGDTVSDTILSDVKVLAVDQTAAANTNEPVVVRAVTLEVTPEEAEILLKGKAAGSIQLTLRNPLDDSDSRHKVAAVKAPVRPAMPAEKPSPGVTVIRGTKVDQQAPRD
jgi:pilus assembly protein CpaB